MAAFDAAMRAFAGNATAAPLDGGTPANDADSHTGDGQYDDDEARNVHHWLTRMNELSAEIVQHDTVALDAQLHEHVDDGCVHHRGTAHVVLAVLGSGVLLQILFE